MTSFSSSTSLIATTRGETETNVSLSSTLKECFVCVSPTTKNNMKVCDYCNFECCVNCLKTYINSQQKAEKNCMNCKKKILRSVLVSFFGKTYVDNIYKKEIKEYLFKEEMMLVPKSLPEIEKRKKIKQIDDIIKRLSDEYKNIIANNDNFEKTIEYYEKQYLTQGRIAFYKAQKAIMSNIKIENAEIKQYKYPCENKDCNSFVDSNWNCNICEKTTCKNCRVIKEENHECKKEDIETTELIKKDSKNCPKCNISIMKTSGCDQMWCVSCHTTFDWKTLHIKTSGVIHNPEYYRYMRENGIAIPRNPGDNRCVDEYQNAYRNLTNINKEYIDISKNYNKQLISSSKKTANNNIKSKPVILDVISNDYFVELYNLYRQINHMEFVEITNMRDQINPENIEMAKNRLRIRFLEKELTEEKYKSILLKQYKEIEFLEETIDYNITILEVSKEYFIYKINNLLEEIEEAKKTKIELNFNNCNRLIKARNFINDVNNLHYNKMKKYKYERFIYIPKLLMK